MSSTQPQCAPHNSNVLHTRAGLGLEEFMDSSEAARAAVAAEAEPATDEHAAGAQAECAPGSSGCGGAAAPFSEEGDRARRRACLAVGAAAPAQRGPARPSAAAQGGGGMEWEPPPGMDSDGAPGGVGCAARYMCAGFMQGQHQASGVWGIWGGVAVMGTRPKHTLDARPLLLHCPPPGRARARVRT